MPQALPMPELLSVNCRKSISSRVLSAQFGDGYSQRSADGINSNVDKWELEYIWLSKTDSQVVKNFLYAIGGYDYFTWIPKNESVSKKFVVEKDSITISYNAGYEKISFRSFQVY